MPGIKIGVLISGGGSNLQAVMDAIDRGEIKGSIQLIVSTNPHAYGLVRGEKAGIPTAVVGKKTHPDPVQRSQALLELFRAHGIQLLILAGYLGILSEEIIQAYPHAIMNIHPALIPSFSGTGFYGIKVHEAALERGVKLTGATVHFVNQVTDGGPIILQEAVPVLETDDAAALQARVLEVEHRLLPRAVALYAEGRLEVVGHWVRIQETVEQAEEGEKAQ